MLLWSHLRLFQILPNKFGLVFFSSELRLVVIKNLIRTIWIFFYYGSEDWWKFFRSSLICRSGFSFEISNHPLLAKNSPFCCGIEEEGNCSRRRLWTLIAFCFITVLFKGILFCVWSSINNLKISSLCRYRQQHSFLYYFHLFW